MGISRARGVLGMGVSAAVWAAVAFRPTALAEEARPIDPEPVAVPREGPVADALRAVQARLEEAAPGLDPEARAELATVIVLESDEAHLDPLLVLAVIEVESGFDVAALSGAGAIGLMQLRGPTLRRELERQGLEGDPRDPVTNVRAGVRYLRRLMLAFPREDVALMAYNAGPNRILGYLRAGEIPERFHVYPRRVNAVLRRLRRGPTPHPVTAVTAAREPAMARGAVAALEN
jgi:soluble lytic murein transglycosylase-like protein